MQKLTVDDVEVPLDAVRYVSAEKSTNPQWTEHVLKLFALWLAENPIVPSDEALQSIADEHRRGKCSPENISLYVTGSQRRMFLKPAPVVPLIGEWPESTCVECGRKIPAGQIQDCALGGLCSHRVPAAIREAMARGKESA